MTSQPEDGGITYTGHRASREGTGPANCTQEVAQMRLCISLAVILVLYLPERVVGTAGFLLYQFLLPFC